MLLALQLPALPAFHEYDHRYAEEFMTMNAHFVKWNDVFGCMGVLSVSQGPITPQNHVIICHNNVD